MKSVKMFGKKIPILGIVLIAILASGGVYAALVNYLSNPIMEPVNVASPIDLSGEFTYETIRYEPSGFTPPTINGEIGGGEWDGAVTIDVTSSMGTVKVLADVDYLYVLLDIVDSNDARTDYEFEVGNDQISINVNPTDGGPWGFPYDLIFETSALSGGGCTCNCPADGGHHCLPWNPKVNSGTLDGWATRWFPDDAQETLPVDLESSTSYTSGRITEWMLPLASSLGDVLQLGGAVDVGDGNSYVYPIGLDWGDPSTYVEYTIGVPEVVIDIFNGVEFAEQLYGASEFFMDFEAKNLANNPVNAPLALVMTCPGIWTEGSPYPYTLSAYGSGVAELTAATEHSDYYSAKLYVENGVTDWAEVSIPVDIALKDIATLRFFEKIGSYMPKGWSVNVLLGVDADADGDFDADVAAWHQGETMHTLEVLHDDSFVQMDGAQSNPTTDVWTETDALGVAQWWTPHESGAGFASFYGSFTNFVNVFLSDVQDSLIPDADARVKCVKLVIGGSGSWMDETAYVDDVTVNTVTYDLEPIVQEILEVVPFPDSIGYTEEELVLVFNGLDTISPGVTNELSIYMRLASNASPGDYTINALVVWEGFLEDPSAIAGLVPFP